jgi:serine protease Do
MPNHEPATPKTPWARLILWGIAVLGATAHAKTPATLTPAQIAERSTNSIALIRVDGGLGSGFVVGEDGRVATNFHVIRGANEAKVVLGNGKEYQAVEVLAVDEDQDLAILRIEARKLKPLPLGDSTKIKPGERIVAIGHPLGLGATVSDGLVSGLREISEKQSLVQISAPISQGSSGGPVFNDRGEVIGVSTLMVASGQNLNFAVPVNALKAMLGTQKGVRMADFGAQGRREREVPEHTAALLEACPAEGQRAIVKGLLEALEIGVPLYNEGNKQACYRIYSSAALDLDRSVAQCEGPRRALLDGIKNADGVSSWEDKAWAMRDAFDGVLKVISEEGLGAERARPRESSPQITRNVPEHPDSLLDDCKDADIEAVAVTIVDAIDSGAPLYNGGNTEACYRIYAGAINDIDRRLNQCQRVKKALREGLSNAGKSTDWVVKSWAVRDSFDGVLKVIRRKLGDEPESEKR